MIRTLTRTLLTVLCSLAVSQAAAAQPTKTVRLLTVGNSFSRNATRFLGDLAKAGGHELVHRPIIVGGASLQLHAERAQLHERDPQDKAGLYTNGRSLKDELRADKWDFVTIQQASIKSHDLKTYQPYAGWLADDIHQHAPTAKLLVHQTWEYRVDDPRFKVSDPKPGEPATQAAMHEGLTSAYQAIAKELKAGLIPVGAAFHLADTDPKWGYKPDTSFEFKQAQSPSLPNQTHSLHVGWRWVKEKDGKQSLKIDGHHANTAGEYLGACVFFEILFGDSPVGNAFVPQGLDADFARHLQETAHRAVTNLSGD